MVKILILLTVFLTTYFGVEAFRRYTLKKNLFDLPNERSSHTKPTPVGGGIIIVFTTLLFYSIFLIYNSEYLPLNFLFAGILIAIISFVDDIYSISIGWRIVAQTVAAFLVIYSFGFWTQIYVPFLGVFEIGSFGAIITFGWIVWLTNAFNFMDGIDGIAGTQALTAGLGWLFVSILFGFEVVGFIGGILAFSSLGFLLHNWQPAKIFMGDVGSAFIGYTFAVIPLLVKGETALENKKILPLIAVILVGMFVFDSIFTFIKRIVRGEKVWKAHRKHIYQKLIIRGYTHQFVTILYGIISIVLAILLLVWLKFYFL